MACFPPSHHHHHHHRHPVATGDPFAPSSLHHGGPSSRAWADKRAHRVTRRYPLSPSSWTRPTEWKTPRASSLSLSLSLSLLSRSQVWSIGFELYLYGGSRSFYCSILRVLTSRRPTMLARLASLRSTVICVLFVAASFPLPCALCSLLFFFEPFLSLSLSLCLSVFLCISWPDLNGLLKDWPFPNYQTHRFRTFAFNLLHATLSLIDFS